MGEDITSENTLPNILDGQKWENHFKTLFTKVEGDIDSTMHAIHNNMSIP